MTETLFWVKDEWLVSRWGQRAFVWSSVLTLALTATLVSLNVMDTNTNELPFGLRLPLGLLGMAGALACVSIWLGMWRYWIRFDNSPLWAKRIWFLVLIAGVMWGGCLYFYFVYMPQMRKRGGREWAR
jgi:prepilin signal peptidase PulO-like enzyme (type II secretory pathway)